MTSYQYVFYATLITCAYINSHDSTLSPFEENFNEDTYDFKTQPFEVIEPYHIKERILNETRYIWEQEAFNGHNQTVPNYIF